MKILFLLQLITYIKIQIIFAIENVTKTSIHLYSLLNRKILFMLTSD